LTKVKRTPRPLAYFGSVKAQRKHVGGHRREQLLEAALLVRGRHLGAPL
jgi:hypothetical protein